MSAQSEPGTTPAAAGESGHIGRRAALGALSAGVLGLQGHTGGAVAASATLPVLRRGFNLSHWFEYERGQGLSAAELRQLRGLGLDHVRIPFDPEACGWNAEKPRVLPFLAELQEAVRNAIAAGLVVVLDLHLEPAFKTALESDPGWEPLVATLWQAVAQGLSDVPATHLVFELLNEPQYYGLQAWRWPVLQRKLLATVRAVLPNHLVLLSGNRGGSLDALLDLLPEPDPATAGVFHYYDPFLFTHQGAAWLDQQFTLAGTLSGVRYPATLTDPKPVFQAPSLRASREYAQYVRAGWGADKLTQDLARAAGWSRQTGLPVVCTEFGCIRANVDVPSRYRWLRDMRTALESQGIGWTVWDYTDIFGLTVESARPGRAGARSLESEARLALGLGPAPRQPVTRTVPAQ